VAGVTITFGKALQGLHPLRKAAYRLIGKASCVIDESEGFYVCTLEAKPGVRMDLPELRMRFCDYVTDENLRAQISSETEALRNVIIALAFGALSAHEE
jgi:His-Xaa-Ser system protein HxsD